jgi:hypothetical protein
MDTREAQELLKNQQVVEEIRRHLWIESEKAGKNLGFDWAAQDWLKKYADSWKAYHLPNKPKVVKSVITNVISSATKTPTREAKSYKK